MRSLARRSLPVSLFVFVVRATQTTVLALLLQPLLVLSDPLSFFFAAVAYPVIFVTLAATVVVLRLGYWLGLGKVIERLSNKYANGYSAVNWVSRSSRSPGPVAVQLTPPTKPP